MSPLLIIQNDLTVFILYFRTESNYQGYENDESPEELAGNDSEYVSNTTTSDRQTPVNDVPQPTSSGRHTPVSDVSVSESPRCIKKIRHNTKNNERLEIIEALKQSTDAIVNRKPKDECIVSSESIGLRMMAMNPRDRCAYA